MLDAPWWGIPVLAGIFGLLGVGIAQFVNLKIDAHRRLREDARRWDREAREYYTPFTEASRNFENLLWEAGSIDGPGPTVADVSDLQLAFLKLELFASKKVLAAASVVFAVANQVVTEHRQEVRYKGDKYLPGNPAHKRYERYRNSHREYINTVRDQFGLPPHASGDTDDD
jgi:hypothetical protein